MKKTDYIIVRNHIFKLSKAKHQKNSLTPEMDRNANKAKLWHGMNVLCITSMEGNLELSEQNG